MLTRFAKQAAGAIASVAFSSCDSPEPAAPRSFAPPDEIRMSFVASDPVDLGTWGLTHGFGFEINDLGHVAGHSEGTFPVANAVFWSTGTGAITLPSLGGSENGTRGINNSDLIAGFSQAPGDATFAHRAVAWKRTQAGFEIIELSSTLGQAEDVNDRGTVVGHTNITFPGPSTAFKWTENDGLTPIPPIAGPTSQAFGINNRGDIVGNSTILPSGGPGHAVIWHENGNTTVLGNAGGNTQARSINDRGEVTGIARTCGGCAPQAFYWSEEDGMILLGTFGGFQSFAFEIDNRGRVAGRYDTGSPGNAVINAFVWTKEDGKIDLPSLGGASTNTGSLNSRGQLTGFAEDALGIRHAVIWQLGPGGQ